MNNCYRSSQKKYFHKFEHECKYDCKFKDITKNEIVNWTISGKSIGLYDLNKKLTVARHRGFIFNQTNKLTKKFYSHLRFINRSCYLRCQIPNFHR